MAKKDKTIDKAVDVILAEGAVGILDQEYARATSGMSQDELDELYDYPLLYVEFDRKHNVVSWVIDYPDYYRGHSGPVAVIAPGANAADVRTAVENAFWMDLDGNPDYQDFARRHGIKIKCKHLKTRPDIEGWPEGSSHWDCTLRRGKKSMKVIFSMGPALQGPPDVADVLYAIAADAGIYESSRSQEEMASDFDMEPKEAARVWKSIEQQTARLQRLLGDDAALYEELLYETEENPVVNPVSPRMRAALYAGAGSILGMILGGALAGGAGAWIGSMAGGAAGGYTGASDGEELGGAIGGAAGGALFPIGAAAGAYIGTYEGRERNVRVRGKRR